MEKLLKKNWKNKKQKIRVENKGEKFFISFLLILLEIAGFFVFARNVRANEVGDYYKDLLITEIMYDPEGNNDKKQWIELYNKSEHAIGLIKDSFGINNDVDLVLNSKEDAYLHCHTIDKNILISPGEYITLTNNSSDDFYADYPHSAGVNVYHVAINLPAKESHIRLSNNNCNLETFFLDVSYENSWGGKNNNRTLEKKELNNSYNKDDWQESYIDGGTPGKENSTPSEPKNYPTGVYINEILPNPKGSDEENEYIELFNSTDEDIDLENWILKDKAGAKYIFKSSPLKKRDFLAIYRKDFSFAINNSDETIYLLDPNEKIVSEVSFSESSKEDVSYNFDGSAWRWSKSLTPGKENIFNNLPKYTITKDSKFYKDIYANFSVKVRDKDKDETKVVWDFGDGHKSYKEETRHKFEDTGKYTVSLKISDGSEDVVKEFKIKVEKFPERKVKIIALSPNPAGKDSDTEWLKVQNQSKKEVNLNGWSVASGWKNLYNHPISEDFILAPQETKTLTREFCAFTLANTKAKVELRYPNGKVASKVKYNKEKIEEDEVYEKVGSNWIWKKYKNVEIPSTTIQEITVPEETEEKIIPEEPEEQIEESPEIFIDISEDEMRDGLGKFSADLVWQSKRKNKIILLGYNTNIQTPEYLYQNYPRGQVAGASTEKIDNANLQEKILGNFWINLNSLINSAINKL